MRDLLGRAGPHRPAHPPARARPGVQGRHRHAGRAPRRRAASPRSAPCRTPTPPNDNRAVTELIVRRAREVGAVRVYPIGAITQGLAGETLAEMGELKDAGCVAVSDDGRPVMNAELMRRALEYARGLGPARGPALRGSAAVGGRRHERGAGLDARRHPGAAGRRRVVDGGARPRAVCADRRPLPRRAHQRRRIGAPGARGQAARAARHLRGDAAPPDAHRRGLRRATTPSPSATRRCARPADIEALREGLADGTIDAIATDHAPHSPVEKDVEFENAAFGMIGLETALPLCLDLVRAAGADADGAGGAADLAAGRRAGPARGHAGAGRAGRRHGDRPGAGLELRPGPIPLQIAEHARLPGVPFAVEPC